MDTNEHELEMNTLEKENLGDIRVHWCPFVVNLYVLKSRSSERIKAVVLGLWWT